MSSVTSILLDLLSAVSVAEDGQGGYLVDTGDAVRPATTQEVLDANKLLRIIAINDECRARLIARYGSAEEQVSRAIGVYGAAEQAAMSTGIAATIDASNVAQNEILAAADIAAVEAVTVSWPVI